MYSKLTKLMSLRSAGIFMSGAFGKHAFDVLTTDEGADFVKAWNKNDPNAVNPILYKWMVEKKIDFNNIQSKFPEFDPSEISDF